MESLKKKLKRAISPFRKLVYRNISKKPWSYGYVDTKWDEINASLIDDTTLKAFKDSNIPKGFGIGFDERIVEYPWIFSRLRNVSNTSILDAGSTFNFKSIVNHANIKNKELTIYTYYPESDSFIENRISYVFGDLRNLPFKENFYDEIVCQSTIEHIDMDNSIYGYDLQPSAKPTVKSYEYLKVIEELIRVLKPGGQLLVTFPYGLFENHGFFQQFDEEMVNKITDKMNTNGSLKKEFISYSKDGWKFDKQENCNSLVSFNPHTGKGKGDDGAAHSRSVCCITFIKN